jgi:TPR repeat protein
LWIATATAGPTGVTVRFTIVQEGADVKLILTQPGMPEINNYIGHFKTDRLIEGKTLSRNSTPGNPQWKPESFSILDLDHLHSASGLTLTRVNSGLKLSCKAPSSRNVAADISFEQGRRSVFSNDMPEAACWFQLAAGKGLPRAESVYALMVYQGAGTAKDKAKAMQWANKSAADGDIFGQKLRDSFRDSREQERRARDAHKREAVVATVTVAIGLLFVAAMAESVSPSSPEAPDDSYIKWQQNEIRALRRNCAAGLGDSESCRQ